MFGPQGNHHVIWTRSPGYQLDVTGQTVDGFDFGGVFGVPATYKDAVSALPQDAVVRLYLKGGAINAAIRQGLKNAPAGVGNLLNVGTISWLAGSLYSATKWAAGSAITSSSSTTRSLRPGRSTGSGT